MDRIGGQLDEGRRGLYEELVREHAAGLYRFAYRLCGQREVAEDLCQEAFYEAWRSIGRLREPTRARAWLYQILRHRYSRWVRTRGRRPRTTAQPLDVLPGAEVDVLGALSRREVLQRGLDQLSDRYKEAFLMVFLQGLSCQEAADQLGVPRGTVLSRIHRARQFLRGFLGNLGVAHGAELEVS